MPELDAARAWPIIYVRGYAMSRSEIDETTADPFCGFNLGSTVFRATTDRNRARKFVFESPLLRLISDFGYRDVYSDGADIVDPDWKHERIPAKSLVVYRYYDAASSLLGAAQTPPITDFARGLGELILRVKQLVAGDDPAARAAFRCYLVAHSMGGLVCRAFLQNKALGPDEARSAVAKLFTYATPHNGIDLAGSNVPEWLTVNDIANFSRDRMASYLDLEAVYDDPAREKRVDYVPDRPLPPERIFCLVGTNRGDYTVARGVSRTFAGSGSDGLVRIENATVRALDGTPASKAFVFRSHSGHFGIVNSEEGYQNLTRFLFGDVKVDIWLDIDDVTLPEKLKADEAKVNALYQIELLAAPRGKPWYLTRRVAEEDSVACVQHKDLRAGRNRQLYLSTVHFATWGKVTDDNALAYIVTLGVRVPDYEKDRALWLDEHFEGGYLFRDSLVVRLPKPGSVPHEVTWAWQSDALQGSQGIDLTDPARRQTVVIPFANPASPGIRGKLRFVASRWT